MRRERIALMAAVLTLAAGAAPAHAATKTTVTKLPGEPSGRVSCVSSAECVTVLQGALPSDPDRAVLAGFRFDPTSGNEIGITALRFGAFEDLTCFTSTRCATAGGNYHYDPAGSRTYLELAAFDPTADKGPDVVADFDGNDNQRSFRRLSCPTANQCTAISLYGSVLTYDPKAPAGTPTPSQVPSVESYTLIDLACPTVSLCAATTQTEVRTFDPARPADVTVTKLSNDLLGGISCPSATQCTVSDGPGLVTTFDPANPAAHGAPVRIAGDATTGGARLGELSCPTTSQCTVLDPGVNGAVTFNPRKPKLTESDDVRLAGAGIDCPTVTQCTIVPMRTQKIVTFNPKAPDTAVPSPATAVATPQTDVEVTALVPKVKAGSIVTATVLLKNKAVKERNLKVADDHSVLYQVGKLAKAGTYTVRFTLRKKVVATKKVKVSAS